MNDTLSWTEAVESLRGDARWGSAEGLLTPVELTSGVSFARLLKLLNTAWTEVVGNCTELSDSLLERYYAHPVWLINGAFIESDPGAIADRMAAVRLVSHVGPQRVLDYGGGIGTVSRLAARHLSGVARVDLVDISPGREVVARRLASYSGIRVVNAAESPYDAVICTEVLEHVTDPIATVVYLNSLLRCGGAFSASWSFAPGLDCHLPQNFHLHRCMLWVVRSLGLGFYGFERRGSSVYSFVKHSDVDAKMIRQARAIAALTRLRFPVSPLLALLRGF